MKYKSEKYLYRIRKVSFADGNEHFHIEKCRRGYFIFIVWEFVCNNDSKERCIEGINKLIKSDNEDFSKREIKREIL